MALGQAAATLRAGAGLAPGKLSSENTRRLAMALGQQNALAMTTLMLPSMAIHANQNDRVSKSLMKMYGAKGQMKGGGVKLTGQLMANARATVNSHGSASSNDQGEDDDEQ